MEKIPPLDRLTRMVRANEVPLVKTHLEKKVGSAAWLARNAREQAKGTDALFHGTRHLEAILGNAVLACSIVVPKVAFTRSPEEAAYWAKLPRDDDEGRGAVLIFDRHRLAARYRLECWAETEDNEQEERVWERHILLPAGLIGIVSEPYEARTHNERLKARQTAQEMKYCMLR